MADNTELNSGSGGDTLQTDDLGTYKIASSKIAIGADGSDDGYVSSSNPLPVTLTNAEYVDDADWTDSTSTHLLVGGLYQSTPQTVTDGDVAPFQIDSNGNVIVNVTGTVTVDGSGVTQPISASSLPLPSGAATESTLTTIDTDTGNIAAGFASEGGSLGSGVLLQGDDGTDRKNVNVDATTGDVQVDVTNTVTVASHAVTNAGTFAVQVDGSALTALQTIDDIVTTDDAAYTAGSGSGVPVMGFFSTDTVNAGDVGVLAMDASRRLLVSIEADNAGIGGGTQYAVDDALGATPTGTLAVGIRDDALSTLTPVEGDAIGLRVDANGALWVIPSGTTTVDNGGTFAVQVDGDALTSLQLIDDAIYADDADWSDGTSKHMLVGGLYQSTPQTITDGDVGPLQVDSNGNLVVTPSTTVSVDWNGTAPPIGAGTEAAALRVTLATDSTGVVSIDDNGGALTVDNAGTFAVQSASAGDVGHDSPDSGNPIKTGAYAINAEPTAVGNADRVNLVADLVGKLVTSPYCPSDLLLDGTASATDTSNTSIIAAQGAGVRIYVTKIIVSNESATDAAVLVKSATTTKLRIPAPANGGAGMTFNPPLRLGANEALQFASSASVTTMYVSAIGYSGR